MEHTRPGLTGSVPRSDRFVCERVERRITAVEIELPRGTLAQELSGAVSNQLVDGGGDEPHNMGAGPEALDLLGIDIVARARWAMVGAHTVGNYDIFKAARLSNVIVLQ